MNNHVTTLEIDGNALLHNLHYFKQKLASKTKILAVVKAFGYGSDALEIACFLKEKVSYFAVAYTDEGIALRNAGIKNPILVLHPQLQNLSILMDYALEPNLYSFKMLDAFIKLSLERSLTNYPFHLKFNTGLHRLGFSIENIPEIIAIINSSEGIKITSVFSHLAASEDLNEIGFSKKQIDLFENIKRLLCSHLKYVPMFHLANTSGVVNYPEAQHDMVRIGIGLYGFGNDENETKHLKHTHHLTSIISQIHCVQPNETVGYNRAFTASKASKIATIPIGHADGVSRQLGNQKGHVLIHQQKAPIIGNVCMDMIMVDVTDLFCKEGDEVILFNSQKMVQNIATICKTIPYEVLTAISQRVRKVLKY